MTWPLVTALAVSLGFVGAMTSLVLPYVRRKSDHEVRLAALEAANVSLKDDVARLQQGGGPTMPWGMPRVGMAR